MMNLPVFFNPSMMSMMDMALRGKDRTVEMHSEA